MRAGRLDRRIDIQRGTPTASASGEPQFAWINIVSRLPASIAPVQGSERLETPQITASEQVEFRIRYSMEVSDLSPKDRIIYPAVNGSEDIPNRSIYDVAAVNEIGRREGLRIIALRRADA